MKKVLLYSGGMDSWLIDKLWKPDVKLFFDIGTANSKQELERVKNRTDVKIIYFPLADFEQVDNNYYLPLRNLHFVTYAAHYGDVICLGATGSSTHKDKNDVFATLAENSINYLLSEDSTRENPVKIVMPYRGMTKTQILAEYVKQGGSLQECWDATFSCYNPTEDGKPCMNCTSCLSKFTAFYNNGLRFDDELTERFITNALTNEHTKDESYRLAVKLKYGKKIICIDFDNTLTELSQFPHTGALRQGCKQYLDELKNLGYYLILNTSRQGIDFEECREICKDNELPFDEYVNKPFASYYVDDKAFKITTNNDWKSLLQEVSKCIM
jgi:7-cyano-7-deazaguanine synthase in queuosine biosynthesis